MNLPRPRIDNPEALLELVRSGEPYTADTEVTPDRITTHYYRAGEDFAVARVVREGPGIGWAAGLGALTELKESGDAALVKKVDAVGKSIGAKVSTMLRA